MENIFLVSWQLTVDILYIIKIKPYNIIIFFAI
jgi:hypothetical protein